MKVKTATNKQIKRKHLIAEAITYYRKYPDKFCEEILEIKLNLYQRVSLRAFFRYKYSMWIFSRGLGKTWLGALALVIYCMLYKGTMAGVIAPSFRQSKILVEDKIVKDLMDRSPFLASEISRVLLNMAEARIEFFNGSRIMAVPTGDGNKIRGYRFHILMCDEYAQIKREILDLVVNPMMNVKRGYQVGKVEYDDDLGNRLLITSSAYFRHNHLYQTFKQYVGEVADKNKRYFVAALPYQIGLQVGLFDSDHIEKEKKRLSNVDFRMEYECIFPNMSENAWIEPRDIEECSTITHLELWGSGKTEYIMALDVARVEGGDNTVCHVFKLVWRKSHLEKHLVYTLSMNGEKFEHQAHNIRFLLKRYPNTLRIFMDTQTIGQGLADELAKEYWDYEEQKYYPPLIDTNDEQAVANIKDGVKLIYGVSPSAENNHRMGMAVKKDTQKKHVRLYSLEAGDEKILKDQQLSEEEEKQILEAEATRREILQIEAKPQGMYLRFDTPNKRGRKDRWSAFGLGLFGADIIESERNKDDDVILVGSVIKRW